MAADSIVFNSQLGPQLIGNLLVTPPGGSQATLGSLLNGGTIANAGTFATASVGSNVVSTLPNFGSITPAGSTVATGATIGAITTQLGTAASTTFAVAPAPASLNGQILFLVNSGSAAVNIGAGGTVTIDGTAGTTGVKLTNGFGCALIPTTGSTFVTGMRGTIAS